ARRLSAPGEDDLRPIRLQLRCRRAGKHCVELITRRRALLQVHRYGGRTVGKAPGLAEKDVDHLALAQRGERILRGNHHDHLRECRSGGTRSSQCQESQHDPCLETHTRPAHHTKSIVAVKRFTVPPGLKPGCTLTSVPCDPFPRREWSYWTFRAVLRMKSQRAPTPTVFCT